MPAPLYLGHEASRAPVVADLLEAARACVAAGATAGAVSARYGPRCVINADSLLEALSADHFVEVADYDAHNDHVMVLGSSPPSPHAALHGLVYRAKKEVGAIVELEADADRLTGLPAVKRGRTMLESALALLATLRDTPTVSFAGRYVFATGRTPAEATKAALDATRARKS